ncbi:MAG: recombinase family protein, partial [Lachnospiraceae bacterium]
MNIDNLIIYLRKSRADNPDESVEEVLSKHEGILQDYCMREYGSFIPEERIYREVVSGETIADRPIMRQIMHLLETGTVDGVLVVDPQRLSRGDLEDCGRIVNTFRYTNTLVVTPNKTYDLSGEYDRKFFEMELTRGNDYLEYTKKILNRGRVASVKRGNYIGSVAPYGYKKVKIGNGKDARYTLEVVPEEAEGVKMAYHLYVHEGYGFASIAHALDDAGIKPRKSDHWSPASLKDIIENPVYIGKIRWNWRKTEKKMMDGDIVKTRPKTKDPDKWIYVDGLHEPIIDEVTYHAALNRRGKNPCVRKNKELANPFAGLLFCQCGRSMSLKIYDEKRSKKNHTLKCFVCTDQVHCHTRSVQYDDIVSRVSEVLQDTINNFKVLVKNEDDSAEFMRKSKIKNLEDKLAKLREKDARQKDAFEDGIYTKVEYLSRNAKLQEQIELTKEALGDA